MKTGCFFEEVRDLVNNRNGNKLVANHRSALIKTHAINEKKTGFAQASFEIALKQLV